MACTLLDLDKFLTLPWSEDVRKKLRSTADREDIVGLTAAGTVNGLSAKAWTDAPVLANQLYAWIKPAYWGQSKTAIALDLIDSKGMSIKAAARHLGIHPSTVSKARKARAVTPRCPCCDQTLKEGYTVNRSVLA